MKLALLILLSCASVFSYSQDKFFAIQGVVKDVNDKPVDGVTIKPLHSKGGTMTLTDGGFLLTGIKIGDTIVFSRVAFKKASFIVDRKYNFLIFKILSDTLILFSREKETSTAFYPKFDFKNFEKTNNRIEFKETNRPITQSNLKDISDFTKVEIEPEFYSSYPYFLDSLTKELNKLNPKYKPQKSGVINLFLFVRKKGKIEINHISGNLKEQFKTTIKDQFENMVHVIPGLQNGRNVDVFCKETILLFLDKNKHITLKFQNIYEKKNL